jgi:hypothetical protein
MERRFVSAYLLAELFLGSKDVRELEQLRPLDPED